MVVPNNETGLGNDTVIIIANNAVFAQITNENVNAGIIDVNQLQSQNMSTSQLVNELSTGLEGNSSLIMKPHRLIVVNNNITQDSIVSNESAYSIIIVNNNGTYMTYVMNKELEDSIFTRLHILKGQGMSLFTLDFEQSGVMVWKVI